MVQDDDGKDDNLNSRIRFQSIMNDIKPNEPNVGNIVRLDKHAEDTLNEGQTLQALRDDVTEFLSDIDKPIIVSVEDERPEYESQSKGYLRINGLNQGIIIKNEEGKVMNFIGDDEFNPRWLTEGFTIGLWVKFLNKSTDGTLFQLGNPFSGPVSISIFAVTILLKSYLI